MIRFAAAADVPAMLAIYAPFVTDSAVSFEYNVPTLEEFSRRFAQITAHFPWLVWEEAGQVLGYCYACAPFERAAFRWCAEPSVYLAPQARGAKVGSRLYAALEALLRLQGYTKLYALITESNRQSLRFHEKAGYRLVAVLPECGFKRGQWHGLAWLEKTLQNDKVPTEFPKSVNEIVENDKKFQDILANLPLFEMEKM